MNAVALASVVALGSCGVLSVWGAIEMIAEACTAYPTGAGVAAVAQLQAC